MNVDVVRGDLESRLPVALEWLERMVKINSFTANRDGVNQLGRLTAEMFRPLGFLAEFVPSTHPDYGDHLVLTRAGRGDHSIACVSHLDTVYPPEEEVRNNFRWQPEGTRIYGPGTDDIKGGTVLLWMVMETLRQHAPEVFERVTWNLFLNSSEEMLSDDFGVLCRSRLDGGALAALVFEGEGQSESTRRLVVARKGRATWRVTVTGRGAHAGNRHHEGANAVVQLGATLQRIAALSDPRRDLTVNPGTVRGGSVLNRVPHEAVAEGELRAFEPEVFAAAKADLLKLAGPGQIRSAKDGYPCQVEVQILSESRPWPRNPATDQLLRLWQATGSELGLALAGEERGGLSDANHLWDVVPTLDGLGPYGDNPHCSERSADGSKVPEFLEVTSMVPKALLNVLAIGRLAGAVPRGQCRE